MRGRLVTTYVLLLVCVLTALGWPLASTLVARETQRTCMDRLADAVRFATLAEPAISSGDGLTLLARELNRYNDLYGITVLVVDRDWHTFAASRPNVDLHTDRLAPVIRKALAGEQVTSDDVVWPWRDKPIIVGTPVGGGGEALGAVVSLSPTKALRQRITSSWLVLGAAGGVALLSTLVVALVLARWVLRPVARLNAAVAEITAGRYSARVPTGYGPSELLALTTAFNEMAETVTDAMDRQRSFIANASHQLRNPLTALRLRVENLAGEVSTEQGKAQHRFAIEETDRLCKILDCLLELAHTERGDHRFASVDAPATALARVLAWRPLAESRAIAIEYEESGVLHRPVRAIAGALDQSLDALIDNALKFAARDSTVTVSVESTGGGVQITVSDGGPGMSDEEIGNATKRFWRSTKAQNVEGAGLGLSIVAVLMESSGGRFELRRGTPAGLAAVLWLPTDWEPAVAARPWTDSGS